jgi:molecular chaperone DnaJ
MCEAPLTVAEAALGCEVSVPTLDGRTTIKVPPGTPPGRSFRLPARGMPGPAGQARGDLHVKIAIEVPVGLDAAARALLEQFAARLGADAHPRRAAWERALAGRSP